MHEPPLSDELFTISISLTIGSIFQLSARLTLLCVCGYEDYICLFEVYIHPHLPISARE